MAEVDRIAHFRVLGRLGAGGMGVVYRARDERLDRDVALKVIGDDLTSDPEYRRRLLQEARAAAAVKHAGVPVVYEVGEDGPTLYIAMELLTGRTLRDEMGGMPVERALRVAASIAETLAKAHEAGIVHRDVKPENVFVTEDGSVKVLDFGIARRTVDASAPTLVGDEAALSREGSIIGTPGYMSPEQAQGIELGPKSDLFSLGVLLYEILSDRRPFAGGSLVQSAIAVTRDEPAPLPARPGLPAEVGAVVLRCLAKDPAERPASAVDLAARLRGLADEVAGGSTAKTGVAAALPIVPRAPRRRAMWPFVAIATVAIASAALWYGTRSRRATGVVPSTPVASASATAPAPTAIAITELPITGTDDPDAKAAYRSALADFRRGDWSRAPQHLREALAKDPNFALATLRLATWEGINGDLASARKKFQWLAEHQTELDERHQAWGRAMEAIVVHDPADYRLAGTLFEDATKRWPADAELHNMVAATYEHARVFPEKALEEARRAVELDPDYADALQILARLLARKEEGEEAARHLDRCVSLHSTDCVFDRMRLRALEGRCEDVVADAKLYESSGGGGNLHWVYAASAVLAQGEGMAAARGFLERSDKPPLDPRSQWVVRAAELRGLALEGRFPELRKKVDEFAVDTNRLDALADLATLAATAALEEGDDAGFVELSERYLSKRQSAEGGYRQVPTSDPAPFFWHELARIGKLEEDALATKLDRWRARNRDVGFDDGPIWFQSRAAIATTPAEATESIRLRPTPFHVSEVRDEQIGWDVLGRLERLSGNHDAARDILAKTTASCTPLIYPFAYVRAYAELGEAYEASKDSARACEAYRKVLAWWGDAPRSRTADHAKQRIWALHCDKR